MRDRLMLGLGLVGAATVFSAIAAGRSGFKSIPCHICGRVDNLEFIDPIGTHLCQAVLWHCQCGNTRAVQINRFTPRVLIEKALARDAGSYQP